MMMTLRGFVCWGVPARCARSGARRHHIMPDQREGRLRFPKNFLKKKKGCSKNNTAAPPRDKPVPPCLPIGAALRPLKHEDGTPAQFFCTEN